MSGVLDFIILEYKSIAKSLLWIAIPVIVLMTIWSASVTWSVNYANAHEQIVTPIPQANNNIIVSAGPSSTPVPLDIITVDVDALKRNNVYPVPFSRDPSKDPAGAYFNMVLNVGLGPYPGVYIVPDVWKKAGGRVVQTNAMPTSAFYYTVYTHGGSSSSCIYDRIHNIVYTIEKDPKIMD